MPTVESTTLSGPRSMARAFGGEPLLTSDRCGWKDLAVCVWRVDVGDYHLDAVPETMVVLHTEGLVQHRNGRRGEVERSFPGQVSMVPPNTPESFRRGGTLSGITMHLSMRRLRQLLGGEEAERAERTLHTRVGFVDPLIHGVAYALAGEIRDPRERGSLYADAMADAIGLHVLRVSGSIDDEGERIGGLSAGSLRRVRERIEDSIDTGISLTELADEVGVSRFQLSRAFQRAEGMAPHRYLTQRRIERAKFLLRHADLPLAEIALECGFSSQAHFCERFRTLTGTSPGQYRKGT